MANTQHIEETVKEDALVERLAKALAAYRFECDVDDIHWDQAGERWRAHHLGMARIAILTIEESIHVQLGRLSRRD